MPEIKLEGCTPEPLMSYLKALGIFRLVAGDAEHGDAAARGMWRGDRFTLDTCLDHDHLLAFFREHYRPTPIIGPWGARSGFYSGSSESSAREALDVIVREAETNPRLVPFRDTVAAVRAVLDRHNFTDKVRDEDKLTLMRACRNELPDDLLPWLDAVYVLTDDSRKFPPLLGTGGNEGSGSYTSTFAQVVVELLVRRRADAALPTSLFDEPGAVLGDASVGHFNPGAVGGPNSGQGFSGGGGVNPWDYLFALEGALLFAGAAVRRLGVDTADKAAFPFTVNSVAVGYGSAAGTEETSDGSRAELWLPLWSEPTSLMELTQLFAEGRAQLRRRQARNAVEFALAACLLGVSRGVRAFVRYGFLKRNGLSYFAAPLGRVLVTPRPAARLLDEPALAGWVERLRTACREKDKTPARYQAALRGIDQAIYEFATRAQTDSSGERQALVAVLRKVGQAERTLAGGLAFCKEKYIRPLSGLNPQWLIEAAPQGDGGREFRLAAALASVMAEKGKPVGPFRTHLEEVEQKGQWANWKPNSTSAVWSNRPLADNLARVLLRRAMESERAGVKGIGLRVRVFASMADVVAFLNGLTDDEKLTDLLWALIGLTWDDQTFQQRRFREDLTESFRVPATVPPPKEFGLIRLVLRSVKLSVETRAGFEPRWRVVHDRDSATLSTKPTALPFHQLACGDLPQAVALAARRLWSDRVVPFGWGNRRQRQGEYPTDSNFDPVRLLAACLFPLSSNSLTHIARQVLSPPALVN